MEKLAVIEDELSGYHDDYMWHYMHGLEDEYVISDHEAELEAEAENLREELAAAKAEDEAENLQALEYERLEAYWLCRR